MTSIVTGGAYGADLVFATAAVDCNVPVTIVSFEGHRCIGPRGCTLRKLTASELAACDAALAQTASALRRAVPSGSGCYVLNLLRRNMAIVGGRDALVAVGKFDRDGNVDGGTAWGVQRYIHAGSGPVFFFDQGSARWLLWNREERTWTAMPSAPTIDAVGSVTDASVVEIACIGSRELTKDGSLAIQAFFKQ